MKLQKQEKDFFGSEAVMQDECYDCETKFSEGDTFWLSAIELPAGQISVAKCERCMGMENAGPPMEKDKPDSEGGGE